MASPAAPGAAGGPGALEAGGGYVALGGEERQDSGSKSRYGSEFLRSVRCGACTKYRRATLGAWAGVFLVVAFVGPAVVDWRFRRGISTALDLSSPDGPSYAAWLSSDAGTVIAYDVYYFDVTNADAVAYAGARPVVVEKGPYAYREKYAKFDVDWKKGGKDVEYFERDWYEFDPSRSCDGCRETDTVTTADVVVASLGEAVDGLGAGDATTAAVAKYALKLVLCQGQGRSRASPFVTRTIKDLHFGRWDDPTLAALVGAVDAVPSPLRDKVPSFLTELTTYVPGFQTNYTSDDLTRRLCGAKDRVDAGVRKAGANVEERLAVELLEALGVEERVDVRLRVGVQEAAHEGRVHVAAARDEHGPQADLVAEDAVEGLALRQVLHEPHEALRLLLVAQAHAARDEVPLGHVRLLQRPPRARHDVRADRRQQHADLGVRVELAEAGRVGLAEGEREPGPVHHRELLGLEEGRAVLRRARRAGPREDAEVEVDHGQGLLPREVLVDLEHVPVDAEHEVRPRAALVVLVEPRVRLGRELAEAAARVEVAPARQVHDDGRLARRLAVLGAEGAAADDVHAHALLHLEAPHERLGVDAVAAEGEGVVLEREHEDVDAHDSGAGVGTGSDSGAGSFHMVLLQ